MNKPLTIDLLLTLRRGADSLSSEARQRVCTFVEGQRANAATTPRQKETAAFVNRGGKADLYYTMFGWMLCYALRIPTSTRCRQEFLNTHDASRLDSLHQTVLTLCHRLHLLLALPRLTPIGMLQPMADDKPLLQFFDSYLKHGSGNATNAWAAQIAAATAPDAGLTEHLLAMQHESGGFLSHASAPLPDLLSTAVALFALHRHGIRPRYSAQSFIDAHWADDGGFVATLLDRHSDTEYATYGLLAVGVGSTVSVK